MYKRNSLFVLCLIGLFSFSGKAQCGANYDEHLEKIVSNANQLPHSQTRIVFAGSSTFRLWDNIAESFPEYEVVNAGIGGSCFDDLYRYKEQLISATEPDILVIYEGDNDIVHVEEDGSQREVFTIHSDAWKLMNWIRYTHPESSRVYSFTKTFAIAMGTPGKIQGSEQPTSTRSRSVQLSLHGLLALAHRQQRRGRFQTFYF